MIGHPFYREIDPWKVRESGLDLSVLPQSESIFALSNGHIGLRANLDEGEPHGIPGTYLNGFYDLRPLPQAESGFGYPETADTLVNVTNGKVIRLLVNDEPFDVRYGELRTHRRTLDLRAGVLEREAVWVSPAGTAVRVRSTRLVSLQQRAVAAIRYRVQPVDSTVRVVLQSELVTNEALPAPDADPRSTPTVPLPLRSELVRRDGNKVVMVHSTQRSGLRMAAAMDHELKGPRNMATSSESDPDLGRVIVTAELAPDQTLELVKFLAYGWSSQRSVPAVRDQVEGALAEALRTGWHGLVAQQRAGLDRFWDQADVELDGDDEVQQALRFGLFHTYQAAARAEDRPIPAKGLTGPGYEGHTFWDMETFVLHALTYTQPSLVPSALRWRQATLGLARERAELLGLEGAAFPWRTIRGHECSGYWPAGTAAFHINADIADAVVRYCDATVDPDFERDHGLELLVETARLWASLGAYDVEGRFRIDGVTGPNEYSALSDNNVYTNLMAQHNLRAAAAAAQRHPTRARTLRVGPAETAGWLRAAGAMTVPYDPTLGVHPQSERFTLHQRWDFDRTAADQYPLLLHFPYFHLYRKQVVKQADLVLALHLRGESFTAAEKRRDFEYYEALTVRDSSLSACTQAIIAAEVGQPDLAYDYLAESALIDLDDVEHNVRDGVHIAALAGGWLAAVAGLGGMRVFGGEIRFAPRLPRGITRLTFRLTFQGSALETTLRGGHVRYRLLDGPPISIWHHGRKARIGARTVSLPVPRLPALPRPTQPKGRAPARRRPASRRRRARAGRAASRRPPRTGPRSSPPSRSGQARGDSKN
ncbi:MAG: glycoside hydrolase family 65 protein [Thermoplasmata archaeon]